MIPPRVVGWRKYRFGVLCLGCWAVLLAGVAAARVDLAAAVELGKILVYIFGVYAGGNGWEHYTRNMGGRGAAGGREVALRSAQAAPAGSAALAVAGGPSAAASPATGAARGEIAHLGASAPLGYDPAAGGLGTAQGRD